jgi:hypothetical protein
MKEIFVHSQKKILPLTEMKAKKKSSTSNFVPNKKNVKPSTHVCAK